MNSIRFSSWLFVAILCTVLAVPVKIDFVEVRNEGHVKVSLEVDSNTQFEEIYERLNAKFVFYLGLKIPKDATPVSYGLVRLQEDGAARLVAFNDIFFLPNAPVEPFLIEVIKLFEEGKLPTEFIERISGNDIENISKHPNVYINDVGYSLLYLGTLQKSLWGIMDKVRDFLNGVTDQTHGPDFLSFLDEVNSYQTYELDEKDKSYVDEEFEGMTKPTEDLYNFVLELYENSYILRADSPIGVVSDKIFKGKGKKAVTVVLKSIRDIGADIRIHQNAIKLSKDFLSNPKRFLQVFKMEPFDNSYKTAVKLFTNWIGEYIHGLID